MCDRVGNHRLCDEQGIWNPRVGDRPHRGQNRCRIRRKTPRQGVPDTGRHSVDCRDRPGKTYFRGPRAKQVLHNGRQTNVAGRRGAVDSLRGGHSPAGCLPGIRRALDRHRGLRSLANLPGPKNFRRRPIPPSIRRCDRHAISNNGTGRADAATTIRRPLRGNRDLAPAPLCPRCLAPLPSPDALVCPNCGALIDADALQSMSNEARWQEQFNPARSVLLWQECLKLLPPQSAQYAVVQSEIDRLPPCPSPPSPCKLPRRARPQAGKLQISRPQNRHLDDHQHRPLPIQLRLRILRSASSC